MGARGRKRKAVPDQGNVARGERTIAPQERAEPVLLRRRQVGVNWGTGGWVDER